MTELVDLDDITPDESLLADVRRTRITTPVTRVLLALVVLGVAFLGGALRRAVAAQVVELLERAVVDLAVPRRGRR